MDQVRMIIMHIVLVLWSTQRYGLGMSIWKFVFVRDSRFDGCGLVWWWGGTVATNSKSLIYVEFGCVAAQENGARKRRAEGVENKATKYTHHPHILLGLELKFKKIEGKKKHGKARKTKITVLRLASRTSRLTPVPSSIPPYSNRCRQGRNYNIGLL